MLETYQKNRFLIKFGDAWLTSAKMDNRDLHQHVDVVIMPGADTVWIGRGHTVGQPTISSYAKDINVVEIWLPGSKTAKQIVITYSSVEYRPLSMSQDAGPAMEYAVLVGCVFEQYERDIDYLPEQVLNFKQ